MIFKPGIVLLVLALLMMAAGELLYRQDKISAHGWFANVTLGACGLGLLLVVLSVIIQCWEVLP